MRSVYTISIRIWRKFGGHVDNGCYALILLNEPSCARHTPHEQQLFHTCDARDISRWAANAQHPTANRIRSYPRYFASVTPRWASWWCDARMKPQWAKLVHSIHCLHAWFGRTRNRFDAKRKYSQMKEEIFVGWTSAQVCNQMSGPSISLTA